MSALYQIRKEIKALLLQGGLWSDGEVLIKRRSDVWNDIAIAAAASDAGQCVVVGVAKGVPDKGQVTGSQQLKINVTIPVTLIELPDRNDEAGEEEDVRWEATVMRLLGSPLGRSEVHYSLEFESFDDVDDSDYVIRQTVFKTNLLLKKPN